MSICRRNAVVCPTWWLAYMVVWRYNSLNIYVVPSGGHVRFISDAGGTPWHHSLTGKKVSFDE